MQDKVIGSSKLTKKLGRLSVGERDCIGRCIKWGLPVPNVLLSDATFDKEAFSLRICFQCRHIVERVDCNDTGCKNIKQKFHRHYSTCRQRADVSAVIA